MNLNEIEELAKNTRLALTQFYDTGTISYQTLVEDVPALIAKVRELATLLARVRYPDRFEVDLSDWVEQSERALEGLESPDSAPNKTKEN